MNMNTFLEAVRSSIHLNLDSWDEMLNPRTRIRMGPTGFDAKLFRDQFIKKAIANPVTAQDRPIVLKNRKHYFRCEPEEDLIMFISLFITYGNKIHKDLKKSDSVFSILFKMKCDLYGIETGITRSGQGRGLKHDQLSLSRIASAFPIHTAICILKQKSSGVLMFSTFFNQELPLLMQHTIFPGLIPAKQFTNDLKEIALVLNVEKSVIFSKCEDIDTIRETLGEMIESSVKYIDAAINNDIDDQRKLEVLKKAGILDVKADGDGELELSAATAELVNKLEGVKALYSLKYSDAVSKAMNNNENSDVE